MTWIEFENEKINELYLVKTKTPNHIVNHDYFSFAQNCSECKNEFRDFVDLCNHLNRITICSLTKLRKIYKSCLTIEKLYKEHLVQQLIDKIKVDF